MIFRLDPSSSGTVSWFRTYHVGLLLSDVPGFLLSGTAKERLVLLDAPRHYFFDIQVLRSGHVARATYGPRVRITGDYLRDGRPARLEGELGISLMAHASGFVGIRATLRMDRLGTGPIDGWLMRYLGGGLMDPRVTFDFHIPGLSEPLSGNARVLMNFVYFDLMTRWGHMEEPLGRVAEWSKETVALGCDRLHELVAEGRIDFPYPVSFGTQFELVDRRLAAKGSERTTRLVDELGSAILRGPDPDIDFPPKDIESDSRRVWWYVEENQALTLLADGTYDEELDAYDPDRTQLLEFLNIRRAALQSIQRETQRVLADGTKIPRARVETWHQMVVTTTDDYILNARIGRLIEPLREYHVAERRIRDLAQLADQVKINLDSFQRRLESAGSRIAALMGALVGSGALVIGLYPLIEQAIPMLFGNLGTGRNLMAVGLANASILGLSFVLTYWLIRRAERSIAIRLVGRRRPMRRTIRSLRMGHRSRVVR